ncbi:50S ribosomal protein 5, chloroplastic [Quillaja saponaria]|uniref:50S ribosomal protein 5, chloroplastic n=1 Tax=Quillaja saponaria TaxID=32244 RepID=A0AAD7PZH5_QUISA|nr:50S ribosomal protein 5, chloroplastic [Quillaja saponaria]
MALLCCKFRTPLTSLQPSSSSSSAIATTAVSRLHIKAIDLPSNSFNGVRIRAPFGANRTGRILVRAASDVDGAAATDGVEPPDSKKEVAPVDKLPLESKLQERQEQKLRMKLAKKIRLRRKRLVRKRRLRKKGRWPPSKMNKLKNV